MPEGFALCKIRASRRETRTTRPCGLAHDPTKSDRFVDKIMRKVIELSAIFRKTASPSDQAQGRAFPDRASVGFQPIARGALRFGNLGIRHLGRNLLPQSYCCIVSVHRGKIEPFVRRDEIGRNRLAGGIHHAEFEERLGANVSPSKGRVIYITNFVPSHTGLPLSWRLSSARCCLSASRPGGVMIATKFELLFKGIDKSNVKAHRDWHAIWPRSPQLSYDFG
jgi:hypothetical protein